MDAIKILRRYENTIKTEYYVKKIGVFGSFARGEEKGASDIDVLVEFKKPVDFFEFLDLKRFLETILKREVDLVTPKALKPRLKDRILNEVIYA